MILYTNEGLLMNGGENMRLNWSSSSYKHKIVRDGSEFILIIIEIKHKKEGEEEEE